MSNNPNNEAELAEFMNSTAPMSQVREWGANHPDGWYDFLVEKLTPGFDDEGRVHIVLETAITAPENAPKKFTKRLFFGTDDDPKAQLPETRLNSFGFSVLKSIGKVNDKSVGTDQPVGKLCADIIGCRFTGRIETRANRKTKKEYTDIQKIVKLGTVPARIDGTMAPNGQAGAITTAPAAGAPAGAAFGSE